MNILEQLSSQQGDKTEASNKKAASQCINDPQLINSIAKGIESKDKKLQSDCIEVFTMISETHPELVIQYADNILPLLNSRETKTRWEAVHTLSFIADKTPGIIFSVLGELQQLVENDKSTIVRDYALDAVANFAKTGEEAAQKAFVILKSALKLWEEKHAKQVLKGFNNILDNQPLYANEIVKLVTPYTDAKKKIVATGAKKIIRRIEK